MPPLNDFTSEWQKRHHFLMNLENDAPFYHEVYIHLQDIARKHAGHQDDACLFHILMYIENSVSIGIDACYERMYRSLGDIVFYWCRQMDMDAQGTSLIQHLVSDAIADAPASSLQQWLKESILSCTFNRLKEVALFFARQDTTFSLIYPDLQFREKVYLELTGQDEKSAWNMLWSDIAFNWHDKQGVTLLQKIAERFEIKSNDTNVPRYLHSLHSERLDAYLPIASSTNGVLTLMDKNNRVFENVVCTPPLPANGKQPCFIGQLVTYLDTTYQNGPGLWVDKEAYGRWNGTLLWNNIEENEKEKAKRTFFITPFGKRISRYDDLYTCHNETDGTYPDEPNLFNFLEWLTPVSR